MGLKIPQDEDFLKRGANCNACTPVPYPVGAQPKFVWVQFFDVTHVPAVPDTFINHLFKCEQSPVSACTYDCIWGSATHWFWAQYDMFQGWLTLSYSTPLGNHEIFWGDENQCDLYFPTNNYTIPPWSGQGGRGQVGLIADMLIPSLTNDYHFVPRDRTYYERQDVGMDHVLVRLACRKFSSNILIYIDYEELDLLPFPV